jgi:hypothetical protein
MPQFRCDVEQSIICYEDASHGEGGSGHVRQGPELETSRGMRTAARLDVHLLRRPPVSSLRSAMELLRYRVQGRSQVMAMPGMRPCGRRRQGPLAYPRC